MFLNKLKKSNELLLETVITFHQEQKIAPDSYIIDMDTLLQNAKQIVTKAKKNHIKLFFMLKQVGRNPYIAQKLMELGYDGVVAVDFKEAELMMKHNIPLGHVGHLVQIPTFYMQEIMSYGAEYITVYSVEKAIEINDIGKKLGIKQKILIKVYDDSDTLYNVQESGFYIHNLHEVIIKLKELSNIEIAGVTSFPCYLYHEKEFYATENIKTIHKATEILKENSIKPELINTPSGTCSEVIDLMIRDGGNCGEPGHGLTGTTPIHATEDLKENICVLYLSEVSHNFKGKAYCYGGGHYRRSHLENALCISVNRSQEDRNKEDRNKEELVKEQVKVIAPDDTSIDYYLILDKELPINSTVIMAFRFQIFVTRSDVILIEGIQSGQPKIIGRYNSLGDEK